MFAGLALVAVAVEAAVGYPDAVYRTFGHPVAWIGRLIARCEEAWNSPDRSFDRRRALGVAMLVLLLGASIATGIVIARTLGALLPGVPGLLLGGLLASCLLAQRSLYSHVADVANALNARGLDGGRDSVARIVGRDTANLDEAAVSRAAIESLAENFSDGVVAPLFWMAVAGLPGAIAYKAVNTADSMIGHKSDRYRAFGWASARFDDLVNLPASRLAALWLILAAALLPGASGHAAMRAVGRDSRHHRSPNAGWPEAAMAGALGLRLAGPRLYGGVAVDDRWMGDGRSSLDARDIGAALRLYRLACGLQIAVVAVVAAITWLV